MDTTRDLLFRPCFPGSELRASSLPSPLSCCAWGPAGPCAARARKEGPARGWPLLPPLLSLLFLLLAGSALPAAAPPEAERLQLHRVAGRLVAVSYPASPWKFAWPPRFGVLEGPAALEGIGPLNARATGLTRHGATRDAATGRTRPFIGITPRYLTEIVAGNEDVLAWILAHELAHVVEGHCATDDEPGSNPGTTPFAVLLFNQRQEHAADRAGLHLMEKAGFSGRRALDGLRGKLGQLEDASPFESRSRTHPGWRERLARMSAERPKQARALVARANADYFLRHHCPAAAARCFEDVVRDLPTSAEGWAGLGYARLVLYCEALSPEGLERLAAGQQASAKEGLWAQAEEALARAVRALEKEENSGPVLRAERYRARANLALARAVRPHRARRAAGERELFEALAAGARLPARERAVFLCNSGLGPRPTGKVGRGARVPGELKGAPAFGEALLLADTGRKEALARAAVLLEGYLREAGPGSPWALVGHARYAALCRALGLRPRPLGDLAGRPKAPWRVPVSVTLHPTGAGRAVTVYLSEPLAEAQKDLGPGESAPGPASAPLVRYRYPGLGIDVLADDQVIGICFAGKGAAPLRLLPVSREGRPPTLRVGMTIRELEEALGGRSTSGSFRALAPPAGGEYLFYPDPLHYADAPGRPANYLGLAVKLSRGRVAELILTQVPPNAR